MTLKNIRGNFPLEDPVQHALQSMDHVSYINGLTSCFLFLTFMFMRNQKCISKFSKIVKKSKKK